MRSASALNLATKEITGDSCDNPVATGAMMCYCKSTPMW